MNYSIIRNILGKIMILTAILMCLPIVFCIVYQEAFINYIAFIVPIILLIFFGWLFNLKKAKNTKMLAREGFIIVGFTWLIIALFGCFPFIISGEIPNPFDAFFEMCSGFTTTGASILKDVTALSHSMKFWRSFSHWIGGMGVLVFILAIIPESKDGTSIHILRAESPGPQVGKLVSKMQVTSRILYLIYLGLTILQILLLWLGPDKQMDFFNSLIYSLGTAGTGGLAIDPQSLEFYSSYSQYVIAIFMIVFGINFTLFYFILIGNLKEVFKNEEVRWYFSILAIAIIIIFLSLHLNNVYQNVELTFRHSLFQVATIISTTGYSTANFNDWPSLAKGVIFILMFFGASAGSTAGGMKISRIIILAKSSLKRIKNMVNPRKVETIYIDKKPINDTVVDSVQSYFIVYMFIFILCALIISIDNFDMLTNLTASLACISNVGPGFGEVGPYGSYAGFSNLSKFILSLEMIAGRLELFPMLILFNPKTWKRRT